MKKYFLSLLLLSILISLFFIKKIVFNKTEFNVQDEIKKADILYEKKDYKKAFDIYSKFLTLNMPLMLSKVAYMYRNGKGVPVNYTEALRLYIQTGFAGLYGSQLEVAYMYQYGIGIKINLVESYKWYRIAAEMHKKKGIWETLNNLKIEMATHEIEIAEKEYPQWKESFFGYTN